ncbi:MAG: protein-disulfide reductase DsbD family protein [Rubripirellula sp.]
MSIKSLFQRSGSRAFGWMFAAVISMGGFLGSSDQLAAQDVNSAADLFPNFSLGGFGDDDAEPIELEAKYHVDPAQGARVVVTATLGHTWHIYSTTQKAGGPTRTKISVTAPSTVKTTGEFTPNVPAKKSISSVYNGLTVEEHEDVVRWTAPIEIPDGFEESITIKVRGLVCKSGGDNRCMPVSEELTAAYAGPIPTSNETVAVTQAAGEQKAADKNAPAGFRDGDYVVEWSGSTPSSIAPGKQGVLKFVAKPDATFHVYESVVDDADFATNFVVTNKDGLLIGQPVADKPLVTKSIVPSSPPVSYYGGSVTWSLPIEVPADAQPGEKTIEGMIAYQACTDSSCYRPMALKFATKINVGAGASKSVALQFTSAKLAAAKDAAAETKWADTITLSKPEESENDAAAIVTPPTDKSNSFPVILGLAFVGGLILNVMPCVLPVVGLKIMGFVSQAGEDRKRILLLNIVYVLGIMAVFLILGVVAAVSKFGWGEQFTYFPVKLGLTLLMFALALSYLGVWEIPAPGMAAGKASQDLQGREGLVGAFSKGIFATILATPCSGPLLGYILGLTLNLSPVHTVAIFLAVGIGMSFPYMVIGFQPKLVSWLPKPGPWMETLKQLMAFLFLGTVAFFFAQFSEEQKVPVFVSLIGVWFGCWVIGQVPNWADLSKRLMAWSGGIAAAALISIWAFNYLKPDYKLAWEDYSEPRLQQLQSEGHTVLVDFGAKWCGTCIYNYETAINTNATREVVDELGVVAMYADWTDYNEEIKSKLSELNSRSIPLLAIYPANRPNDPIILRDLVTQGDVVEALRKAGASITTASAGAGGVQPRNSIAASH